MRTPVPPFNDATARRKVRAAEDAWNTCDPRSVAAAYTVDSVSHDRSTFLRGRQEIQAFLTDKWRRN